MDTKPEIQVFENTEEVKAQAEPKPSPPKEMSNEEIVSEIKRLAMILRNRTSEKINAILEKKKAIDAEKAEIGQQLKELRAKANIEQITKMKEIMEKIASGDPNVCTADYFTIDKNGKVSFKVDKMKETPEIKQLQEKYDMLVKASALLREQLKALGYGEIHIHDDHIYIKLPKPQKATISYEEMVKALSAAVGEEIPAEPVPEVEDSDELAEAAQSL